MHGNARRVGAHHQDGPGFGLGTETFCTDHWRCRFLPEDRPAVSNTDIVRLLADLDAAGFDVIKTENLYTFDGNRGYSLGQGQ